MLMFDITHFQVYRSGLIGLRWDLVEEDVGVEFSPLLLGARLGRCS